MLAAIRYSLLIGLSLISALVWSDVVLGSQNVFGINHSEQARWFDRRLRDIELSPELALKSLNQDLVLYRAPLQQAKNMYLTALAHLELAQVQPALNVIEEASALKLQLPSLLEQQLALLHAQALLHNGQAAQALWYADDVTAWAQQNSQVELIVESLLTLSAIQRTLGLTQAANDKAQLAKQYAKEFNLTTEFTQFQSRLSKSKASPSGTETSTFILLRELNKTRQDQLARSTRKIQTLSEDNASLSKDKRLSVIAAISMGVLCVLVTALMLFVSRRLKTKCQQGNKIDSLTKLLVRNEILSELGSSVEKAKLHQSKICVAKVDLDKFRYMNKIFGYAVGDSVLACFGRFAKNEFTANTRIGRTGSNDFLFIFEDMTIAQTRKALADFKHQTNCIGDSIQCDHLHGERLITTCSIGVAQYVCGDSAVSLLSRAEQALEDAKQKGCSQIVLKQLVTSNL